MRRFASWHAPIQAVLEATPDNAILRNDVHYLDPLARWSRERIVLLGDAAHATTPGIGQGAAQALEDVVALADALDDGAESRMRSHDTSRSAAPAPSSPRSSHARPTAPPSSPTPSSATSATPSPARSPPAFNADSSPRSFCRRGAETAASIDHHTLPGLGVRSA
jgi:FAD binding domain